MSLLNSTVKTLTRMEEDWTTISTESALRDKKVICLFFSALWCPPCRPFCQLLRAAYESAIEETNDLEIIFISSDRNEEKMKQYMTDYHGNWLAIPYDQEIVQRLRGEYRINSVPQLIVCKNDGTIITKEGKDHVTKDGAGAMFQWVNNTL